MQLAILTNCTSQELLKMYMVYPQGNGAMNMAEKTSTKQTLDKIIQFPRGACS